MSIRKEQFVAEVVIKLKALEGRGVIKGLGTDERCLSLAKQIVESHRRVEYVETILERDISSSTCDPKTESFDPLKAAIAFLREGNIDESFWLIFFFVHFGKNAKGGWRYAREVYGAFGEQTPWTWDATKHNPAAFRTWLGNNIPRLKRNGVPGGFGNHRKYQSLDAFSDRQTGAAFETYISWIGATTGHTMRFDEITAEAEDGFDVLYKSMSCVSSFGRMAKFDYLCMVGKLGLYEIEPTSVYVANATGPKVGGNLLFGGSVNANLSNNKLEQNFAELSNELDLPFSMQTIEDAICNWQKSPDRFIAFRG